jgi:hypothetical protein
MTADHGQTEGIGQDTAHCDTGGVERDEPRIRPYRQSDLDDLYRICLLTGANGGDASHLFTDPMLLGHGWTIAEFAGTGPRWGCSGC